MRTTWFIGQSSYSRDDEALLHNVVLSFYRVILKPRSCSRVMKAVGMLEAFYEEIFEFVMSKIELGLSRWDCFWYGSLVKEVDGRTTVSRGLGDCLKVQNLNAILCDSKKWEAKKKT
ncbi:hypothetical protein TorRG33x02_332560 [Trema orientale]|uniref:Uncharacterized protein n=1 Tax=Trema orientale TaxID=63057 RepID=A0A2P5B525_TREOI|nr:hypothetical protein TorRG33x02_332560 [Trema orientale]